MTKGRLEFNQGDIFLDFFSVTKHQGLYIKAFIHVTYLRNIVFFDFLPKIFYADF